MKIRPNIKQAMETLKIEKLRKNQLKPINAILDGYDTMVIAPTSFGKSLIFLIPAIIHQDKLTVVIEPLLALMHDQVQKLRSLGIAAAYHGAVIWGRQVFSSSLPVRSAFNRKGCSFLHPFSFARLIKARNCLRPQDIKKML